MCRSAERTEKINRFDPKQLNSISIYLFSKYHKFLSRLQKRAADCRGEACNREILKIYCICTDVDVDTVVGWLWACVRISTWTVVKSTQSKLLPTIYITPVRCISFHCQAVVLHCVRCSGRSECNKMWTVTMWAAWSGWRLGADIRIMSRHHCQHWPGTVGIIHIIWLDIWYESDNCIIYLSMYLVNIVPYIY